MFTATHMVENSENQFDSIPKHILNVKGIYCCKGSGGLPQWKWLS